MDCPSCGADNRPERKFCASCGSPLGWRCDACGASNLPAERFCGECGTRRTEGTPSSPRPAAASAPTSIASDVAPPVSERRLVSVLFADLVGFTSLSGSLDIEAVRELQSAYFDAARQVVERYGGTVEKFIGDAVMAVWGYPTAHEDDPERAVRAALDVVDAVAALGEARRVDTLAARAAVATGEAAVTLGAVGQGMVTGDLVNTAARLQGAAGPGGVVVDEATGSATHGSIGLQALGALTLKGKDEPVAAWQALRVIAGRHGVGRSDAVEAPFVGRRTELRALKEALATTSTEGRARLVAIVGQAGIGKSRLAWELEKYVDGISETVYWHRGRSPAYGDGVAYWALGEMVRERAGIAESDDPVLSASKLDAMLETYVADAGERRWLLAHLRTLLGLEEQAAGDRTEQFAAWRRLFEAIAERGTTALVFEDLHWADDGLIDFVDALLEWSRERPILVVALARPELLERRPGFGSGSRNALRLHLDPLTVDEMRELLETLAPDLPEGTVGAIVDRAEGIPLYAIELVRMLRGPEGGAIGAIDPRGIEIPPTLHALVAARLDALEPDDRSLVQVAAVLGQSFTMPALVAVSERPAGELEPRLRSLVRREILAVDADPRSPERGQYGFVQSVIREVALSTLSRRDRRARHLAAARYFESLGDEELAPVLAAHYLEAYRAAPDDEQGRAVRAQARVALRAAADRAGRLHNYEQAVRGMGEALALTEDEAERAGLLVRQAELAEAGALFSEAATMAERARAAFEAVGDGRGALLATAIIGRIELARGHVDEATVALEHAVRGLDPATDPEVYARLASELARAHMLAGRYAPGLEWTERSLAAAGPIRATELIAEALNTRGVLLQESGRLDEGILLIRAAVDLAAASSHSRAELRARYNLAGRMFSDDPRAGAKVIHDAVEVATRTGRRDWQATCLAFAALFDEAVGDWDEALATLDELARISRASGSPSEADSDAVAIRAAIEAKRGDRTAWPRADREIQTMLEGDSNTQRLGAYVWYAGDVAIAEGRYADALEVATRIHDGNWLYAATFVRARAAVLAGDLAEATAAYAVDGYRSEVGVLRDAERLVIAAGIAGLQGRRDEALGMYRDAARTLRVIDCRQELATALLDAVTVLGADDPAAPEMADEARAIFEQLGARAYLDRLEEALATPSGRGPRARRADRAGVDGTVRAEG
jgi:class 3 adenylate cyclase/tetratricopeptide (TPR) repeat protein